MSRRFFLITPQSLSVPAPLEGSQLDQLEVAALFIKRSCRPTGETMRPISSYRLTVIIIIIVITVIVVGTIIVTVIPVVIAIVSVIPVAIIIEAAVICL